MKGPALCLLPTAGALWVFADGNDDGQERINLLSTLFAAANKRAVPYNCFSSLGR